jgi:hypothetical protein
MIFSDRFAERFKVTGTSDWASVGSHVDISLSIAILKVLDRNGAAQTFLAGEPFDTESPDWLAMAEEVFVECNGAELSLETLFEYHTRIHQLSLAPFGFPFVRTLIDRAERDGWTKALAHMARVPIKSVEEELAVGDEDALVKEALETELRYHSNDD